MKRAIVPGVALILVALVAAVVVWMANLAAHPSDPEAVVRAYLDAWQAQDLARAQTYYAAARPFPSGYQVEVSALQAQGNQVTWTERVVSPLSAQSPRFPRLARLTASVEKGKIVSVTVDRPRIGGNTGPAPTAPEVDVLSPGFVGISVAVMAVLFLLLSQVRAPEPQTAMRGRLITGLRQRMDEGWQPFAYG